MCHTISGTEAAGSVGPDLTHLASRATIGAGLLPNTAEHLARWVVDPQSTKPGNAMPPNALHREDVPALVAYLRTLR
jgi:cytochrome c oxidase subunit 2